jgi:hemerythrin superfamily protein
MPNGIDLIVADHREVDELFAEFESDPQGAVVGRLMAALTAHDEAEQHALYPMAGTLLGDLGLIERSATAHSLVKKQFDLIKSLEGEPLVAAVNGLRQLVTEHVADEEQNLLPALAEAASPQQLEALGARILQVKQRGG